MATSPLVPAVLPFAIDAHEFLIDSNYERQTVQVIRQQADTSTEAGEQTLSPLGLWRRSQESWHHGAGQDFLDGKQNEQATDPHRFRSSKGTDIWTRGQVSLLHPTLKSWSTSNTNLHLVVSQETNGDSYILMADGTEVYWNSVPFGLVNSLASQTGTGWSATNATISASGGRMRLTATASASVTATSPTGTSGFRVDPGRGYVVYVESVNVSGSGGKVPQAHVTWYDALGATISSTTPVVSGGVDTLPASVFINATAPDTAVTVSITISYTAAWTNGDIHDISAVQIGPLDVVAAVGGANFNWRSTAVNGGQPAQTVQSLVSDGYHVWAALGTSGLHRADPVTYLAGTGFTTDVPAAPASGQISLVGYANGFLLAAGSAGVSATRKNSLWRVDDPLGSPSLSLIKTHPNASFEWTFIASGRNCVYAGGNSGGNGEIYKILFDPNTGTLSTAASPATSLPDGETIHALYLYAGTVILGTGHGVRIGQADGAGNIDYGGLIETDRPVRCLEPQGRWCWFGWTQYDALNSGLGRIDLGFQTDTLTPAWASDLMTVDSSTGDTVSCVTFLPYGYTANQRPPVRVFSVGGEGVYIEDPGSRVPFGTLATGTFRYATSEPKMARSVDVRHHALPAGSEIQVQLLLDGDASSTDLGESTVDDSYGITLPVTGVVAAESLELEFLLSRTGLPGDYTVSPELTRWTAKVLPLPSTIDETFTVKIHMKATVQTTSGTDYPIDVPTEIAFLKGLERSRSVVEMQLGDEVHDVYVLSSKFTGEHWHSPKREYAEGILELTAQTVRG